MNICAKICLKIKIAIEVKPMAKGKTIEKTAEKCAVTLEFIKKFVDNNGYPSTVREVCAEVGVKAAA